ncbi:hypothetical protein K1T73_13750 [Roseovarius sp. SCSIO 43702]|uniref:hypothetical protein n=1 Tax=Roseovarius sp. SCSIO 43702 TaxID=2823043 RepID=UPI001C73C15B|nr:hypothetical protein [Roseovarius sp. SCSIO 43702]QYX56115.1 hypothetical protein K1T73_13750 [Roseovarius sp. SCSIO 43702]
MRIFVSTFALAILSLALVLSGPVSRGMAQSGKTLAELCLDGVDQVVRVDRDGQPVAPGEDCDAAHACCIVSDDAALPGILAAVTALVVEEVAAPRATGSTTTRIEYLLADPRGPPAAWTGQIDQTEIRS